MSKVAFVKVKHEENGVHNAVWKAMELTDWKDYVKGDKIFVKINGISDQLVPGQCTSPWVIDAVLKKLREYKPKAKIYMGDANLAAAEQLEGSAKVWGVMDLAKKYNVEFVNLSKQPVVETEVNGKVLKKLSLPKILLDVDCILNMPVAKAHCLTDITCCLKNHWGLIPRFRHQFHMIVNDAIADMNNFFRKTTYNVVDATICLEGNAPRTGVPKVCDVIFAGHDRVSIDTAAAKFMGFNPKIPHILESEKRGVGETKYTIVGDKFYVDEFVKPEANKQPIFFWEMLMRKVPVANYLIFQTPIFRFFAWGATKYNTLWWYNLKGKKYAKEIIFNTWYGEEFKPLWERTGGKGTI
jgi:uncharacterized protein (DUF362 family)